MNINHNNLPQFDLDLSSMSDACEIKGIMKKAGVLDYVYAFIHRGEVMKYGQSSYKNPFRKDPHGERIYRQARYIPGWKSMPSTTNSSGSDILPVLDYFPNIHKDDVRIHVWDMTGYNFAVKSNPEHELTIVENQLIENHRNLLGRNPVGNLKDESYIKRKAVVTDKVFENLFDEA